MKDLNYHVKCAFACAVDGNSGQKYWPYKENVRASGSDVMLVLRRRQDKTL